MNNSLIEYSLQLSMLSILFSRHLLSEVEYKKIKIEYSGLFYTIVPARGYR